MQEESGLTEEDITPVAARLIKHVAEEPVTTSKRRLVATKKKYQSEKYDNIAALVLPCFDGATSTASASSASESAAQASA